MLSRIATSSLLRQLEQQRQQILTESTHLPPYLQSWLRHPLPQADYDVRQQPILALDIETTGLDASSDQIVSIGWVPVINNIIRLSGAQYFLVKPLSQNHHQQARIHHILPQMQQQGIPLPQAIEVLFTELKGKVLLAHGSVIERQFIRQFTQLQGWPELPLIWLDTLKIEQTYRQFASHTAPHRAINDWRLSAMRQRYNLPDYQAHHALSDAISTAELYLAQQKRLYAKEYVPLETVLKASG